MMRYYYEKNKTKPNFCVFLYFSHCSKSQTFVYNNASKEVIPDISFLDKIATQS